MRTSMRWAFLLSYRLAPNEAHKFAPRYKSQT